MCARSDAGLQDEGELVPLRCSGFAPGCMCTFTVGNSQQQGIYQPNWCWAHPSRCQLQEGNLCLHYVTMLSCGRCWGSCRWAERQRDGILQAQQDPVPWANGLNWGGGGGATCGQHHAGLWALSLGSASESSCGWGAQAAPSNSSCCRQGASGRAEAVSEGESSSPAFLAMHETRGTSQKLLLLQKMQPSSFRLISQTLQRCFI